MRDMNNATIRLKKRDGGVSKEISAVLTDGKLIVFDATVDIEESDLVLRMLPSGREESYEVLKAQFYEDRGSTEAFWSCEIRKTTEITKHKVTSGPTINIQGSTGIQVGNHNLMSFQVAVNEMLERIEKADTPEEQKKEAKSLLESFLSHPLISAIAGGVAAGLAS